MIHKNINTHIENFLSYIPAWKFISYKTLAEIFCTSPLTMAKTIKAMWHDDKVSRKTKKNSSYFREPSMTNFYISLITRDNDAIEKFTIISHKISLQNPGEIVKIPTHYHITLADLHNIPLTKDFLTNLYKTTQWLQPFSFSCSIHKPYIDKEKQKVIFWSRIPHNPFLLTLHYCITKLVPRRADKPFTPHITLGKLLKTTTYNPKFLELQWDVDCGFNQICITANIDNHKDVILFSFSLLS